MKSFWHNLLYEPTSELFRKANLQDTPETRAYIKEVAKRLAQKNGFSIKAHNRVTVTAAESALVGVLNTMVWTFYVASAASAFLTSDNPVFIPDKFGLGNRVSELSFPLSTQVALVASWNTSLRQGLIDAKPQIVREINRRTIHAAWRNVYSPHNENWVLGILGKSNYDYHPIYSVRSAKADVV